VSTWLYNNDIAKHNLGAKMAKASQRIRENAKRDHSPKWDNLEKMTDEEFRAHWHKAMDYYRLEVDDKLLKPKVIDWMGRNGYSKEEIQTFKKTKDWRTTSTMSGIAANLLNGMPDIRTSFNSGRSHVEWLKKAIANVIVEGKNDIDESPEAKATKKASAPVINIQDRIREQAGEMSEELDYAIDSFLTDPDSFDPKAFKIVSLLRGKGTKSAHARYIKGFYQRGLDDLNELSSGNGDEQLREAYSFLARKNVRKLIEFYQSIMTACDQIAAEAKVLKKPRKKKVKPAEDLVKRVKFKVSDDKLGITSTPPAQIIGAQGVVVYNTKTRKMGIYIANSIAGLNVKGASITDFTTKSVQKTLRKPEVQLKEFKEQNTQRRVETWFGKIKTTEVALNGRLNEEIVILKVFK
jgi:hypothetical protein